MRRAAAPIFAALMLAGCGSASVPVATQIPKALRAGLRPIGRGARFQPAVSGTVTGRCTATLGRRAAAHIEVFGANRVVLLAAGIGTETPRRFADGRLTRARCFGDAVTLDPTGTVYFRPAAAPTLGTVFSAWGEPLTATRVASFTGGRTVVYVGGRAWHGAPAAVPLTPGAEIVVEIGPHVPPHRRFVFPAGPSPQLR